MKLISHSDYEDSIDLPSVSDIEFRIKSRKHRQFLKQPLELWMFVPCKLVDGVWVVLEEPKESDWHYEFNYKNFLREYQQAKERCLFEGFEIKYFDLGGSEITTKSSFEIIKDSVQICIYKAKPDYFIWNFKTIENLVKYNLQLTQTAIKQIGL